MSKLYSNFISRRIIALTMRLTYHFDSKKDQKICGCSLVKMEPAVYGGARGETNSAASRYWALDKVLKIFTPMKMTPLSMSDAVRDVSLPT